MRVSTWYEALYECQQQGQGYVLITVVMSAGSAPREAGCKMLVTDDQQFDTIGGGHLEFEATRHARALLAKNEQSQKLVSYPLSSSLGQCCGGAVKILYEVHVNHHQHIAVFGAGHVAQSLVPMLAQLPVQISWVDGRERFFEDLPAHQINLSNVKAIDNDDPCQVLKALPNNTWVIILTHNHQLDYDLVEAALKHPSIRFVGMIGSQTKAKRFCTKLAHRGFSPEQIARLISPIGDTSIPGKRPVEVSVSICAQLIRRLHSNNTNEYAPANSVNKQNAQPCEEKATQASSLEDKL